MEQVEAIDGFSRTESLTQLPIKNLPLCERLYHGLNCNLLAPDRKFIPKIKRIPARLAQSLLFKAVS